MPLVREILEKLFDGEEQRSEYTIVKGGALAGTGKHSYTEVVLHLGQKKQNIKHKKI